MSGNLKIAVQFYGHVRTFELCAGSIAFYLLNRYDCDVFMHTWSQTEHETQTWHKEKSKILQVGDETAQRLKSLYQLKSLEIEKQPSLADDSYVYPFHLGGGNAISAGGMNFMLYSQNKVNHLRKLYQKKHNINYDLILTLRPDIRLEAPLNLDLLYQEANLTVDYPARFCASNSLLKIENNAFVTDLGSDIIFAATADDMDKIMEVLSTFDFSKFRKAIWTPESAISGALFKQGIATIPIMYYRGRDWQIIRGKLSRRERRKKYVSLKITSKFLRLELLSLLSKNLVNLNLSLFNLYNIKISIGKKICPIQNL